MTIAQELPRGARLPLTASVVALCAIGTAGVAPGAGYAPAFAHAFVAAALARLLAGRDGRALLPRRLLLPLGYTVSAASFAYLLQRLGARGSDPLWTLMCVTSVFQALVLLWRQGTFSSFLLILLSSVHAAGISFSHGDAVGLAFVAAYVALLVWTLVLFERRASLDPEAGGAAEGVARVRAVGGPVLPLGAVLRSSLVLVVLGLPAGALLYLAVPRGFHPWRLPRAAPEERVAAEPSGRGEGVAAAPTDRRPFATSGPGGRGGAPLGSVAEIQRNFEPWFEVGLADGSAMPPTVVLRDNTLDYYDVRGTWHDTLSEQGRAVARRDFDDGAWDGRIPLANAARGASVRLRIEALRGGQSRLYLQPDEVDLRILRDGRPVSRLTVRESANKTFDASVPLRAGDVLLQGYVPPVTDDVRLVGRRSDGSVAPLTCYLQVPDACRARLEARAREVVGAETDPWRRARRLEAWLRSTAFTYSLKIPALDGRDPLSDFVERTRTANCEAFAYALTIMLRCLGHPSRYVRGLWGGDRQLERRTVVLRGLHYHAWTEMYLAGVGWVPLNPTPPDRRAVDAETLTAAKERWESQQDAPAGDWSFLGYDEEDWRGFWGGAGRLVRRWILDPCAALFGRRTGFVGIPLLLLAAWSLRRRRRRARLRALVVPAGGRLPPGPYGEALLLLAARGVRRRPQQTLRELLRGVGLRFPAALAPLRELTALHEACRYGGRDARAFGARPREALGALRRALAPHARPSEGPPAAQREDRWPQQEGFSDRA